MGDLNKTSQKQQQKSAEIDENSQSQPTETPTYSTDNETQTKGNNVTDTDVQSKSTTDESKGANDNVQSTTNAETDTKPTDQTITVTTNSNEYTVKNNDGELDITAKFGGKKIKLSSDEKKRITKAYAEKLDYSKGEHANFEGRENVTPTQQAEIVAEESSNPQEIAQAYQQSKQRQKDNTELQQDTEDNAIAQALKEIALTKNDAREVADISSSYTRTNSFGKKREAKSIDLIAERATELLNNFKGEKRISINDVYDFISRHEKLSDYKEKQNTAKDTETNIQQDLKARFKKVTGLNLTDRTAKIATNIKNENNETNNNERTGKIDRNDNEQSTETNIDDEVPFQKDKDGKFTSITENAFNTLIDKLKKPFYNAFENLKVLTSWGEFTKQHKALKGFKSLEDIQYSQELNNTNETFNAELKNTTDKNADKKRFDLGKPSAILKSVGIADKPLKLHGSKLRLKAKKHGFKFSDIKDLPKAIQNPIAIFEGAEKGSHAILTELEIKGNKVLVSLKIGKGSDVDFNIISSIHDKRSKGVIHWINNGKTLFANKEKSLDYLGTDAPIATADNQRDTAKLRQEFETAKQIIKDFKNPISDSDISDVQFQVNSNHKSKQLTIINKNNPAPNEYNTWIRSEEDILTAKEAFEVAFEDGEVVVYSSHPIEQGNFITPSRMNAESYAGGGKIYSKKVKLEDVAWIDEGEGQYAKVQFMKTPKGEIYGAKLPDGTIYINPKKLNANTPIHEFSHLWEQLMPEQWKKGVEMFKQTNVGKKLFAELKKDGNYKHLSDEKIWSEAVNTYIGNLGEKKYHNTSKIGRFAEWVKDTFQKIGAKTDMQKSATVQQKIQHSLLLEAIILMMQLQK